MLSRIARASLRTGGSSGKGRSRFGRSRATLPCVFRAEQHMRYLDHEAVRQALPWDRLIAALRETFAAGCEAPLRTVHTLPVPDEPNASLLMMPAWQEGDTL